MSERVTEDIVRNHFKNDPLFNSIKLEEQRTSVAKARQCLSKASKNLTGKIGSPEFIITIPALPNDIIIVECKADAKNHQSKNKDKPADYAVDGAIHYSKFLSKEFNVISIAVSGKDLSTIQISSFYQKQGEDIYSEEDCNLLDIYSYISKFQGESKAKNIESGVITKTAIELNNELNDYSIVEYERCTLISAILLALQDESFRNSYQSKARTHDLKPKPDRLASAIVNAIKSVLQDNKIDDQRVTTMINEYEKIKNKALAKEVKIKKKKATKHEDNYVLRDITSKLEKQILPLMELGDKGYDVLGRFYTEFIRYAGTDKKTGLVLTPQHIAELFCEIVNLGRDDVVFDSCCGTGSFLIAAMKKMISLAGNDESKKRAIKEKQLVGIEKRTDMFTFACSNMMMSGDGKSHIYEGDSFSEESRKKVKELKPTVAFLNPPYDVGEDGQLEFIENALSCIQKGGRCAAIVQMSCVTSTSDRTIAVRQRLLDKHTLKGVFSIPDDLFHPVGVVTCIVVFEAHNPHPSNFKSYFGYFKDDGFTKTKHLGRVDRGKWQKIKSKWLESYINRESEAGLSILHAVKAEDEWCAEAYMATDYSNTTKDCFVNEVKKYASFKMFLNSKKHDESVTVKEWKFFILGKLFQVKKGKRLTKANMTDGNTPFVGAIDSNNGVSAYIGQKPIFKGNTITVNYDGNGVAEAYYQPVPYWALDSVNVLYPNFPLTPNIAIFLVAIIRKEKFRFNYGRKWHKERMEQSEIKLPVNKDGEPDWKYMEGYIKSLPYSKILENEGPEH